MKLPEQQDMAERGRIMKEKWMKSKDSQKWKDRGMTAFSELPYIFIARHFQADHD
jgi:hypothetical protein